MAQADLYPRLALNGFLGVASNDFRTLFEPSSFTAFIIPNVQWNILNYGRIANNIITQDVRLDRQALEYQQAALVAGREVEDAIVGFLQSQQRAASLAQSVVEANRAVELVLLQFEGGVTDFNRVFNAQSTLVSQQDQLAQTQGDIALRLVDVYRALGGGWRFFMAGQPLPGPQQGQEGAAPGAGDLRRPPAVEGVVPRGPAAEEVPPPAAPRLRGDEAPQAK